MRPLFVSLFLLAVSCTGAVQTPEGSLPVDSTPGNAGGGGTPVDPRPNDAAFVSIDVASSVSTGAQVKVSVTMKNTGTNTWSLGAGHYLGSQGPMDNFVWGTNRIGMDAAASVAPGESYTFSGTVKAPAAAGSYPMQWQVLQDAVEWFGEMTPATTIAVKKSSVDPQSISVARLKDFQGDFGIRVPSVAPKCPEDPVTHIKCVGDNGGVPRGLINGVVFTAAIWNYAADQRQAIYAAYRSRGYTHFPIHIPCDPNQSGYHALFPPHDCSGDFYNSVLHELYDAGLIPVCAVIDDGQPATLKNIPQGFDRSLCRVVFGQWETPQADCQLQRARAAFPDALLYWETPGEDRPDGTPLPDSCSPQPMPTGAAWFAHAKKDYGLTGVLIETTHPDDAAASIRYVQAGYPAWKDLQGVLFETDIYQKFWDDRGEALSIAYNDQIRVAVPWLTGFNSGGTTHPSGSIDPTRVPPSQQLDLHAATILNNPADLADWPVGTKITRLEMRPTGIHVEFSRRDGPGRWPDITPPGWDGPLQYTLGMALSINGKWYASAPIQLWYGLDEGGGPPGDYAKNWFYDPNRWAPMTGHQPAPGEQIGIFVVAGNVRNVTDGSQSPVKERSNVVLVPMPSAAGATYTFDP